MPIDFASRSAIRHGGGDEAVRRVAGDLRAVLEIVVAPAAGEEAVAAEHVDLVGGELLEPGLAIGVARGSLVEPHQRLDRVGVAPGVVERVGRCAAQARQPLDEPLFAAIDRAGDRRPLLVGELAVRLRRAP